MSNDQEFLYQCVEDAYRPGGEQKTFPVILRLPVGYVEVKEDYNDHVNQLRKSPLRKELTDATRRLYSEVKGSEIFQSCQSSRLSNAKFRGGDPVVDNAWAAWFEVVYKQFSRPMKNPNPQLEMARRLLTRERIVDLGYRPEIAAEMACSAKKEALEKRKTAITDFARSIIQFCDPLAVDYRKLLKRGGTPSRIAAKYVSNLLNFQGLSRGKGRRGKAIVAKKDLRFAEITKLAKN